MPRSQEAERPRPKIAPRLKLKSKPEPNARPKPRSIITDFFLKLQTCIYYFLVADLEFGTQIKTVKS